VSYDFCVVLDLRQYIYGLHEFKDPPKIPITRGADQSWSVETQVAAVYRCT
jgi:hypothetical protein